MRIGKVFIQKADQQLGCLFTTALQILRSIPWQETNILRENSHLRFLKKSLFLFLSYVWGCFACTYACVPCSCLLSLEVRTVCQITWDWNYRWLKATMWALGIEPCSYARETITLKYRANF